MANDTVNAENVMCSVKRACLKHRHFAYAYNICDTHSNGINIKLYKCFHVVILAVEIILVSNLYIYNH